jgi:uncharacterized protein YdiU (UPF0061 family)
MLYPSLYPGNLATSTTLDVPTDNLVYLQPPPAFIPQLKAGVSLNYGGTQFGEYQDLGDGRSAIIHDCSLDPVADDAQSVYIAKGGFTTPYTKFGRGNYSVTSAINEARTSLELQRLGIRTQNTIAVYKHGEDNATSIIRRSCPFRIGTFEYVYRHNPQDIDKLWHSLSVYYPVCQNRLESFRQIVLDYAALQKQWEDVGFVHGCLNTDNMSAIPEAIDFGHSQFSFNDQATSSIDPYGRYSRKNQDFAILSGLNIFRKCLIKNLDNYTAEDLYADYISVKPISPKS